MLNDGDRVLVGISGGKDSQILWWYLNERIDRIPIKYDLIPVYVDPGFDNGFSNPLVQFFKKNQHNLRVEYTDFGVRGHSPENRENPCFLCSRLRRQRLFEIADQLGCNKLALGHHKDDIIETFFMNIFYAGEISTMSPSQSFFQNRFTLIRPLAFVEERQIMRLSRELGLPAYLNPCPSAETSKRKEIKEMLFELYATNSKIKGNVFRAMKNIKSKNLLA